jgi:hypothetical protein
MLNKNIEEKLEPTNDNKSDLFNQASLLASDLVSEAIEESGDRLNITLAEIRKNLKLKKKSNKK